MLLSGIQNGRWIRIKKKCKSMFPGLTKNISLELECVNLAEI